MLAAFALAAVLAAAATPAPRWAAPQALRPGEPVEIQVHENALVGEYAAPGDTARHPAVIVLGGIEGGIPGESFGFARQGYAAFSVAYFGADPLPKVIERIPVERVSRAIDWLRDRPEVDPTRIGIVAIGKGSELALLAAARDPRIKSVAVISPTAYVWFAPTFDGNPDRSSWTISNGEVPYIPIDSRAENNLARTSQTGGTYQFRDLYDASLAGTNAATVASATIPVERIAGPLLCVAGDDDREWDSAGACKTIAARRKAANRDARDQVAIEPGAGHALALGGKPSPETVPAGKMTLRLGGTPAANARAGADAWNRTLTFFAKTL
ncbi:MAG: hydrolase of the alpha/beta superfamily [Candidatus Eremiobacteraeota bacterium]|nr:hydrolase of the alpha/beta superfamily [Candidatus Eremiobacteraeota bacterium]